MNEEAGENVFIVCVLTVVFFVGNLFGPDWNDNIKFDRTHAVIDGVTLDLTNVTRLGENRDRHAGEDRIVRVLRLSRRSGPAFKLWP